MPRLIISIVLLFCAATVHAQIYKCTKPDGSVEFSDMPCSESAEVVDDVGSGSSGIGGQSLPSSITFADGSIQQFKEIISIEVKSKDSYMTGKTGLHIYFEGTHHLVEFENLESLTVLTWDRKYCGNTGHLCKPRVKIKTREREITTQYDALRSIKVVAVDKLDGVEKEMTLWFANRSQIQIRSIRF